MKKFNFLSIAFLFIAFLSTSLSAQVNISNTTTAVCSDTLYDTGGQSGDYGNNENIVFVINPPGVDSINIVIDSLAIGANDTLFFYSGTDTTAPQIFSFTGTSFVTPVILTSIGPMTVHFKSNAAGVDYGWRLEWYGEYDAYAGGIALANNLILCQGDTTTVEALTIGGIGESIQWYYNTTPVGTNAPTYLATAATDMDSVWYSTVDSVCPYYSDTALAEVFSVTTNTTASVTMAVSDPGICVGESVNFTATPVNGGTPNYVFTVNGDTAQTGLTAIYTTDSLVNGDVVIVEMATSLAGPCLIDSLSYDTITVSVGDTASATVAISGDPSICAGDSTVFTASFTNGGPLPIFEWFINDVTTSITDSIFGTTALTNGDEVKVVMASSVAGGCLIDSVVPDSLIMNVNSNPSASITFTQDVLCNLDSTGYLVAVGSGGNVAIDYTYSWNDYASQTNDTAFNLPAGLYTVTITDDSLCFNTDAQTVNQPSLLSATPSAVDALCFSDSNGTVTANETGGTGPYTFAWNDYLSQTTATASNLPAGTYTVIVTDGNLCTYTDSVAVSEPALLSVGAAASDVLCNGDNTGFVSSTVSGGSTPYAYLWDDLSMQTNDTALSLPIGTYQVVVTDVNGCQDSASAIVNEPTALAESTSSVNIRCYSDSTGSATVVPSGGTLPYSYLWDDFNTQTTASAVNLPIGSYTVTVTDSNGCVVTPAAIVLTESPEITTSMSGSNVGCASENTGSATVVAAGGIGSLSYLWTDLSAQTTASASNLVAGSYQVTVTDDTACFVIDSITLTEPPLFTVSFNEYPTLTFGGANGALKAIPSGGNGGPYTHVWQNTVTNDSIFGLVTGWYTDTVRDASGCVIRDSGFVAQPDTFYPGDILINGLTSDKVCDGENVGMVIEDPLNPSTGGQFGPSAHQFSWEFSKDLLTWNPLPGTNDQQDYNFSDTILSNTFVRRLVSDSGSQNEYTNIVFLNYVADQNIVIAGLSANYCENNDSLELFPSPTSPGTGSFVNNPWMNASSNNFIPANAASSIGGSINQIGYQYTDQFGCMSEDSVNTSVYTIDVGTTAISQTIYTPNDLPGFLSFTYPTGSFNGVGVYFSGGNWRFNPALVDPSQYNIDLPISFQRLNPTTGCTSYDTINVQVVPSNIVLSTNVSDTSQFFACYSEDTAFIYVSFTGDSITHYDLLVTNNATNDTATHVSVNGGFTSSFNIPFNPKVFRPVAGGGSLGATALQLNDLKITLNYTSRDVPSGSFVAKDLELMHMGNASISGTANANGTPGYPFQYCEYTDTVNFTASFIPLAGRTTEKFYETLPAAGIELVDALDGTAKFSPNSVPAGSNRFLRFTYIDDITQCATTFTRGLRVSLEPNVTLSNIDTAYCSNDPSFVFVGSPASAGPSNPPYFESDPALGYGPLFLSINGQNSASYLPDSADIGSHFMSYNYTSDTTGCFNADTVDFDIIGIPALRLERKDGNQLVHCVDGDSVNYVRFINNNIDKDPLSSLSGSGFLSTMDTVFYPDVATIGSHVVTYSATDEFGCSNQIDSTLIVLASADASFTASHTVACVDPNNSLVLTPANKNLTSFFEINSSGDQISGGDFGASLSIPFDSLFNIGNNLIEYTYDDGTGCVATTSANLFVNDTPSVYFIDTLQKFQLGHICYNDGSQSFQVFPSSLDSTTSFLTSNVAGLNNYRVPNGQNTVSFSPNISSIGNKFIAYHHTDVNGCTSIERQDFEIHDKPQLSIIFQDPLDPQNPGVPPDNKLCAIYDEVILRGQSVFEGGPALTVGNFTPSPYGLSNGLLNQTSPGTAEYGDVPADINQTDFVLYSHQETSFGCLDSISQNMVITRRPPSDFVIDINSLSNGTLCPDEVASTISVYDSSCVVCPIEFANVTRTWEVNEDNSTSPAGKLNPAIEAAALVYNGYNVMKQRIQVTTPLADNLGCFNESEDSLILNSAPDVALYMDSIYCSNDPVIQVKGSPASGSITASRFSSDDMEFPPSTVGFTYNLPNAGDSTYVLDGNTILKTAQTTRYNMTYWYKDDVTFCSNDTTADISLYLAPQVEITSGDSAFCNYDDVVQLNVDPFVGKSGYNIGLNDTVWSTKNAIAGQVGNTIAGRMDYLPATFVNETKSKRDEIFFVHTNIEGCSDTTSFIVRLDAKPLYRWDTIQNTGPSAVRANVDSVCFNATPFNMLAMEWDSVTNDWKSVLIGDYVNNSRYFRIGDSANVSGWQGPRSPSLTAFDPSLDAPNDNVISQIHFIGEDRRISLGTNCRDTISSTVVIRPNPVAGFTSSGFCTKFNTIFSTDSSKIDRTLSKDNIASYFWTVDGFPTAPGLVSQSDTLQSPYDYGTFSTGLHAVSLVVKSDKGCSSDPFERNDPTYNWQEAPNADFTWSMGDECDPGMTLNGLFNQSATTVHRWDFGDGSPVFVESDSFSNPTHGFPGKGRYLVTYEVGDTAVGCSDTVKKYVNIRDYLNNADYDWTDSMNTYDGNWSAYTVPNDQILQSANNADFAPTGLQGRYRFYGPRYDYDITNSDSLNAIYAQVRGWSLEGNQAGSNFIFDHKLAIDSVVTGDTAWYKPFSGGKSWITYPDANYANNGESYLIGPCFDFTGSEGLMVQLSTLYKLSLFDGVVLQYTTDPTAEPDGESGKGIAKKWKTLGEYVEKDGQQIQTGQSWFNDDLVLANPGNQGETFIGWSDKSLNSNDPLAPFANSAGWQDSRYALDSNIYGQNYVRFRLAFKSTADINEGLGFAVDDFSIKKRKRNLVFEAFTNTAAQGGLHNDMADFDVAMKQTPHVIDLQYHTSFPDTDPMNLDNNVDPSARTLYYSISSVPFVKGDGNKFSDFMDEVDIFTLKGESVADPKFSIDLLFDESSETLETKITAVDPAFIGANSKNVVLQIALVEKSIDGSNFTNLNTDWQNHTFKNVVKKLYPNGAGRTYNNMIAGDTGHVFTNIDLDAINFYDNTVDYKVIAFVQDKNTQEIYQGEFVDANKLGTGVKTYEDLVDDGINYTLYPNPTNGLANMAFDRELKDDMLLQIYNQVGVLVLEERMSHGISKHSFDMNGLTPGMYFVMLNDGSKNVAIKKLMLSK